MRIVDCTQGEGDWLQARTGRVTASEVGHAIHLLQRAGKDNRKAGDSSAARDKYKAAIVGEILSGQASLHYVSAAMKDGTAKEPYARQAYERRHNEIVFGVGFVLHPTIDRAGASPDGLVGDDGGLEIKAPLIETHINYIKSGRLPPEYEPQVMWNLACAEREWWDFMSYCPPPMPERHQQFRIRVYRDDKRIAEMEAGVIRFLEEVDEEVERIRQLQPEIPSTLKQQLEDSMVLTGDFEKDRDTVTDALFGDERILQA